MFDNSLKITVDKPPVKPRQDIGLIIDAIRKIGPRNFSAIARTTGIPEETVRYNIKRQFPKLGLQVRLTLDRHRLGLRRVLIRLKLEPSLEPTFAELFSAFSKTAFLTHYSKELTGSGYVTMFAVPVKLEKQFYEFLNKFMDLGVIREYRSEAISWGRVFSLRPELYDFREQRWNIDWKEISAMKEKPVQPDISFQPPEKPDLDRIDILMLKELQLDSLASASAIARKLGVNARNLRYHLNRHVSRIASSYHVRWFGKLEELLSTWHIFKGLDRKEYEIARFVFCNHPFAWFEAGRETDFYVVQTMTPATELANSLGYIRNRLASFGDKMETLLIDERSDKDFTIPYELYDDTAGWFFDTEKALGAVIGVIPVKIKK